MLAGPPSTSYRAGNFICRHRFGVGVAAAALLLLIGFAATMAVQARRIAKERDHANREAAAPPSASPTSWRAWSKFPIPARPAANPSPRARFSTKRPTKSTPAIQGFTEQFFRLRKSALPPKQREFGTDHPATLASVNTLGLVWADEHRYPGAEKRFREVWEADRRSLGPSDAATFNA